MGIIVAVAVFAGLMIAVPSIQTSVENASIYAYEWAIASVLSLVA